MELTDTLRVFGTSEVASTHYEDCWQFHPGCAMHYAADTIDALTAENTRLREALEQLEQWDMLMLTYDLRPGWHGAILEDAAWARRIIANALGKSDLTASLPPSTEPSKEDRA